MATLQANGSAVTASSTKNKGGSAVNVATSSVLTSSIDLGTEDVGVFGSVVVDGPDTDKAVVASNFANSTQMPIAKRLSNHLGGIPNSILLSGAAQPSLVKSVNYIESILTVLQSTAYRGGHWNIYTGYYESGYPETSDDNFGADTEARVSRSMPGSFAYKRNKNVPVMASYRPKTG